MTNYSWTFGVFWQPCPSQPAIFERVELRPRQRWLLAYWFIIAKWLLNKLPTVPTKARVKPKHTQKYSSFKWDVNGYFLGCSNYRLLSGSDREKSSRLSRFVRPKCDRNLQKAWYRFSGAAGKQMPTQVVPTNRCGTRAPGWLRGGHPTVAQGAVSRTVCFHWSGNQCRWSRIIRVQNCGAFFVYELTPTPFCNLRYCGDNTIGEVLTLSCF